MSTPPPVAPPHTQTHPESHSPEVVRSGRRLRRNNRGHRRVGLSVIAVAVAFVLTACGSGETGNATAANDVGATGQTTSTEVVKSRDPGSTAAGVEENQDSASSASAAETADAAAERGMIEIGDFRHDLTVTRCLTMFGAIDGGAVSVSEPYNVDVSFSFSPEDWAERNQSEGWTEAGTIRLDSDDPYSPWVSGPSLLDQYNLPSGLDASAVDFTTYDISDDGRTVTGEAKFVELNAALVGT